MFVLQWQKPVVVPRYQLLSIAKSTLIVEKWVCIFSRPWLDHGQDLRQIFHFYSCIYSTKFISCSIWQTMRQPAEMNCPVTIMPIVPSWCLEKLTSFTHLLLHNTLGRHTSCCSMLMNCFSSSSSWSRKRDFITKWLQHIQSVFVNVYIVHHRVSTWISVACSRHKATRWNLTRGI